MKSNKQENKYYTPTIEELKEGFRYLQEIYDEEKDEYTGKYKVNIFDVRSGLGHDDYHTFTEGRVLCKYLDKEDIESLGWKDGENYGLSGYVLNYATDDSYQMYYDEDNQFTQIYNWDAKIIFEGIIKNKSELKRLLKQLGIYE